MAKKNQPKNGGGGRFGGNGSNALLLLLVVVGISVSYLFWYNNFYQYYDPVSTAVFNVNSGNIKQAEITGMRVRGEFKVPITLPLNGERHTIRYFETHVTEPTGAERTLKELGVPYTVVPEDKQSSWPFVLMVLAPLFILAYMLFMRQGQQNAGSRIFNVGKSRARLFLPNTVKIRFKDVAGVEQAKEDLADIVEFLKNPERFNRIGAKIPRGVLLTGAPGNGKTMLAKAVAGEAQCPFFSVSGSDFVEVFVGVGAARVRDLFAQARKHAPCIVFVDEIDAVGRHRNAGLGGGYEEREQTLNQLLAEMDGFSSQPGEVIVIGATNRPDVLDKALLRPGRFDRKVEVPYPDLVSREHILNIHVQGVKLAEDIDIHKIARGTSRFSGADLANLINEAALIASRQGKEKVTMADFEMARDRILVGAEHKTLTRTEQELEMTAYHEGGHALVSVLIPHTDPLHKVTILSRGGTLGITWSLPEGDEVSRSEEEMLAQIKVCLGGRIAEEVVYGKDKRTTGASNDLGVATKVARDMVCHYGMSDHLGPVTFHAGEDGRREYSEETARRIDAAVSSIFDRCYKEAQDLIIKHRDQLDKLARALLEKETLEAAEVYTIFGLPPRQAQSFRPPKEQVSEVEVAKEEGSSGEAAAVPLVEGADGKTA